jgi:hypothetical protein
MSISFQPKTDSKPAKLAAKVEMTEDNWHDDSVPF